MKPPVTEVQFIMAVAGSFLLGVYHKTGLPIELLGGGMATAFALGSALLGLCEDKKPQLVQPLEAVVAIVGIGGMYWSFQSHELTMLVNWVAAASAAILTWTVVMFSEHYRGDGEVLPPEVNVVVTSKLSPDDEFTPEELQMIRDLMSGQVDDAINNDPRFTSKHFAAQPVPSTHPTQYINC